MLLQIVKILVEVALVRVKILGLYNKLINSRFLITFICHHTDQSLQKQTQTQISVLKVI